MVAGVGMVAIAQRDERDPLPCWNHAVLHMNEGEARTSPEGAGQRKALRPQLRGTPDAIEELAAIRARLAPNTAGIPD